MIDVYVPEVVLDQPRIAPAVCEVVARTVSKHVRMDANPKIRSLASLTDQVVDRLASEWPSLTAVQSSLAYDFFRFLRGPQVEPDGGDYAEADEPAVVQVTGPVPVAAAGHRPGGPPANGGVGFEDRVELDRDGEVGSAELIRADLAFSFPI